MPNPVTWFSIPAEDTEAATKFYHQAFNWEIQPETKEGDNVYSYTIAHTTTKTDEEHLPTVPSTINGCIVKRATGITAPIVLIWVDDLKETAEKIKAAGGSVVSEEIPMPTLGGSFILVKDPEGNMLEVFAPTQ